MIRSTTWWISDFRHHKGQIDHLMLTQSQTCRWGTQKSRLRLAMQVSSPRLGSKPASALRLSAVSCFTLWGPVPSPSRSHQGKPECLFLLFDTNFTEKLAKIWVFHKIFTFQQFHPMITWPDNSTKCCIILLNYARYSKRIGKFTSGHCKFYCTFS